MQGPPRRQRSLLRPFPTLSLLAIYSTTPVPSSSPPTTRLDDAAVEATKVLFFSAQEDVAIERRARLMGTVFGMADFARMLSPNGGPAVRAVHSTKQRMVWLEPETGFFIHATIDLPRTPRHSRGASSATTASNGSTGGEGPAQLEDAALLAGLEQAYREFRLQHGSFAGLAEQGRVSMVEKLREYWQRWSKAWDVSSGDGSFEQVLGALPQSPLATAVTSSQIAPLLAQFSASNPSTLPILLHGTSVLSLPLLAPATLSLSLTAPRTPETASIASSNARPTRPPPPPMSEQDLLALVKHLQSIMVRPASLLINHGRRTTPSVSVPEQKAASGDPSRWSTYTLGMSSFLSQPTMPSMPTIPSMPTLPSMPVPSLPSLSMPPMPSIPGLSSTPPTASSSPSTSSGWGFKKPSWSGTLSLGGHKRKSSKASSLGSVEGSRSTTPAPVVESAAPSTADEEQHIAEGAEDRPITPPAGLSPDAILPAPTTPAVDLAPEVDSSALAEAMGSFSVDETLVESLLQRVEGGADVEEVEVGQGCLAEDPAVEATEEDKEAGKETTPVWKLFCGDGEARDTPMEVRTFERGPFTLALANVPLHDVETTQWLGSRSHRLLEAVETILELVLPPPPPYAHRHLRKDGLLSTSAHWPLKEESWSGKPSQDDVEVSAALFDCLRGFASDPPILESLVRLSSSQWVVGRRSEDLPRTIASTTTTLTDVFVVLPAKVGKDGSLVDAGEELRRFERAYG